MSTIHITKLDAAGRQLAVAIDMFAVGGDPVAIHGLAMAAHQILADLSAKRSKPKMLAQSGPFPGQTPSASEQTSSAARSAANFFKHADRDPDAILPFDPEDVEYLLYDACARHHDFAGKWIPQLRVFICWYISGRAAQFHITPAMTELVNLLGRIRAVHDRAGFFREVLAMSHAGKF